MKKSIVLYTIILTSMVACTNGGDEPVLTQDSVVNVIVDSNATIPDTNSYFNPIPDSENLPDEPGPTITPPDSANKK
jgi:hypothetical protein